MTSLTIKGTLWFSKLYLLFSSFWLSDPNYKMLRSAPHNKHFPQAGYVWRSYVRPCYPHQTQITVHCTISFHLTSDRSRFKFDCAISNLLALQFSLPLESVHHSALRHCQPTWKNLISIGFSWGSSDVWQTTCCFRGFSLLTILGGNQCCAGNKRMSRDSEIKIASFKWTHGIFSLTCYPRRNGKNEALNCLLNKLYQMLHIRHRYFPQNLNQTPGQDH